MNGVMFQAFHWFLDPKFPGGNGRGLWQFLADESEHFRRIGIDAIWIPPASQTQDEHSIGYDVYDHFNVGEFPVKGRPDPSTRYGTKQQLHDAIAALHG